MVTGPSLRKVGAEAELVRALLEMTFPSIVLIFGYN